MVIRMVLTAGANQKFDPDKVHRYLARNFPKNIAKFNVDLLQDGNIGIRIRSISADIIANDLINIYKNAGCQARLITEEEWKRIY